MQLVPQGKSHIELWAVAVGDGLIRAGQRLHRRFAVVPNEMAGADELFIRLEGWRMGTQKFITFGDPLQFSQRRMEQAGVARRTAYDAYMNLLRQAGMILTYGRSGSFWCYPWNKRSALIMIRRRLVELPYPIAEDAPPLFVGHAADTQLAQHTQLPQVSTVFAESGPKPPELKQD